MAVIASEQVVLELGKEVGEPGGMASQTLWGNVLDALRDLYLHNMPVWDTVKGLPLNAYNAIDWPCALVKPLITFIERNGRAVALHIDDNILHTADDKVAFGTGQCCTFDEANGQINDLFRIDNFSDYYRTYSWGLGELYGVGEGYNHLGMVTHDKKRRQSFIKGCSIKSDDTFGLFFKSNGISKGCHFPEEMKEAVEYFALHKYFRVRNPNLAEIMWGKYQGEFYRLQCFEGDEGIDSWIDAFNTNQINSPKG